MKYDTVTFTNIGPIEKGQINRNKINVFFGSNNSGKSIAARLVYGIGQLNTSPTGIRKLVKKSTDSQKRSNDFYGYSILNSAGFHPNDLLTRQKRSCNIVINSNGKTPKIDFGFKKSAQRMRVTSEYISSLRYSELSQISKDVVYIPAGRIGIMQFFTSIIKFRNRVLRDLLDKYQSDSHSTEKTSAKEIKDFAGSLNRMPEYMEQLYDLILDAHEGINKDAQDLFSKLFTGSIEVNNGGLFEILYRDPAGFLTEIESAGSGTVSYFPIVAGVYYVKKGGTLIIEEPEDHLEPSKQLGLVEELVKISKTRKMDLVFTTNSDYILKKLLALVSRGEISHNDLGLYYFNRAPDSLTRIEKIPVDNTGEAEQTLFDDALNTLVEEFSE